MKWINDVVFAILAAHVWGSLMLFVWLQAVKRLEDKGLDKYAAIILYLPCRNCAISFASGTRSSIDNQ